MDTLEYLRLSKAYGMPGQANEDVPGIDLIEPANQLTNKMMPVSQ